MHRTSEAISGDEPFTIYFSQWKISELVPLLFKYNNIPPTFEFILHYWINLFGISESSIRLLPALCTALTAPAIYLITKDIKGTLAGILASLLFILSPFQMEWAHLIRSYSLMILGGTWSMYFYLSYFQKASNKKLAGWILFSFIATAAHYLAWLVIFTQCISFLFHPSFKAHLKKVSVATFILLILNSPLLFFLIKRFIETASEGTYIQAPESFAIFFTELFKMIGNKNSIILLTILTAGLSSVFIIAKSGINRKWQALMGICSIVVIVFIPYFFLYEYDINFSFLHSSLFSYFYAILAFLLLLFFIKKLKISHQVLTLLLWMAVPLFIMYFASFKTPMFVDRYLSFISPSIPVLLSLAIFSLPNIVRFSIAAIAIALLILNFSPNVTRYSHPNEIMAAFKEYKTKNNSAIWSPGYADIIFTYHFDKNIFQNVDIHQQDTIGNKIVTDTGYTVHKEGLRRELFKNGISIANDSSQVNLDLEHTSQLIFVDAYSEYIYPNNGIRQKLEKHFGNPKQVQDLGGYHFIYLYEK
ncbi:MAG: glycosyltransferase family 39 protein [Flavobacteriales bacterium]